MSQTSKFHVHTHRKNRRRRGSSRMDLQITNASDSSSLKLLYSFILFFILFFCFFGITVWGLTHPPILDRLCKLQNKVIRAIKFKDNYTHAAPLFYDLKFLQLHDIHKLNLLCFVYNCRHQNLIHPSVISLFLYLHLTIMALDKPQGEIFLCKDSTLLTMERDLQNMLMLSYGTI